MKPTHYTADGKRFEADEARAAGRYAADHARETGRDVEIVAHYEEGSSIPVLVVEGTLMSYGS